MNLFVLDTDPDLAVQGLDDKRLGSALREACQMMSVAAQRWSRTPVEVGAGAAYRPSHQGHPVTLWVGATVSNFNWTLRYGWAMSNEWQHRYGTWHSAADRLPYLATFVSCLPAGPLLPFQNSARHGGLGLDFSHLPVPESYRVYLQERWKTDKRPPTFRNREWPKWVESAP